MDLSTYSIIAKVDHHVIHPVPTIIVVMEDAEQGLLRFIGLLFCNTWHDLSRLLKDGGSGPHGAKGIRVASHLNGDEPGFYFSAVVPDFEGDVSGWHVFPEFVRKSQTRLRVMGVQCSRSMSSLTLAHHLSSTHSFLSWLGVPPQWSPLHSVPPFLLWLFEAQWLLHPELGQLLH